MRKPLAIMISMMLLTGTAFANPVKERQEIMKDLGRNVGAVAAILKGEKPFDAATVQSALNNLHEDANKLDVDTLFPAGSDVGDTEALPKIWEDSAGFQAEIANFQKVTAAAAASKPEDLESLKVSFKDVGASCGACHQNYRIKK